MGQKESWSELVLGPPQGRGWGLGLELGTEGKFGSNSMLQ